MPVTRESPVRRETLHVFSPLVSQSAISVEAERFDHERQGIPPIVLEAGPCTCHLQGCSKVRERPAIVEQCGAHRRYHEC